MKAVISLIKIVLLLLLSCAIFFLLINPTFFYETYKTDDMAGDGISIGRFMYLKDNKFYTFLSKTYLEKNKNNYLNGLQSCFGKYYYDEKNDLTITNYDIVSHKYYNSVVISYENDNYCGDEYKLSDRWIYEYANKGSYVNGDLNAETVEKLIDVIYNSSRVSDPLLTSYKASVSYEVQYYSNDDKNTLIFSDFSENELLVQKKSSSGKDTQYAVYSVDNAAQVLEEMKNDENK